MMEKKGQEYRNLKNNIGMFDALKGLGMLIILISHTIENYRLEIMSSSNPMCLIFAFVYATIAENIVPIFFVISGYGFRKRPINKCVKQQMNLIMKPYIYVMVISTLAFLCTHYACFRYLPASLLEAGRIFGGYLFALPVSMTLFHIEFLNCGVAWYFVAMFLGWITLNFLMTSCSEKYCDIVVITTMFLGWLFSVLFGNLPFCLVQGLVSVGYLYVGYRCKKQKAFFIKFPKKLQIGMAVFILLKVAIIASGTMDNTVLAHWAFGPLSLLISVIVCYIVIYAGLYFNFMDNGCMNVLRIIGRYSMYIFCIHSIERAAIPWWYLVLPDAAPLIRCIVIFLLRTMIIVAGCWILNYRKRKRTYRKRQYLSENGRKEKV